MPFANYFNVNSAIHSYNIRVRERQCNSELAFSLTENFVILTLLTFFLPSSLITEYY